MRYKQDLAEFLPITVGARLIQERAGIAEDEAREDIVAAVRNLALMARWWNATRNQRRQYYVRDLPHGFLDNLSPDLINWENSVARCRGVGASFTAEIEVSRSSLDHLWPDGDAVPSDSEDTKDTAAVGRPTQREKIEVAYAELVEEKKINFDGPKTALYEPIREKVRKALDDPNLSKGLGDEVIRDTIAPLFEAGKAKKQSASA